MIFRETFRFSKHRSSLYWVLLISLFLSACSSGSSSSDNTTVDLTGSWVGTIQDPLGSKHQLTFTISGATASAAIDGSDTGLSYQIAPLQGGIYSVEASDGTLGGLFIDTAGTYLIYADEDGYFAIGQKGANTLPTFALIDLAATWAGYEITVDAAFDLLDTNNSSATVNGDGSFTGSNAAGISFNQDTGGELTLTNATLGAFSGNFVNSLTESGPIIVLQSADLLALASLSCSGSYPENCTFALWSKQ